MHAFYLLTFLQTGTSQTVYAFYTLLWLYV